jgi:Zn-dependent protease with chaperone function
LRQLAILQTDGRMQSVNLSVDEPGLAVIRADGSEELIGWWRLFRHSDEDSIVRIGRLDQPKWELRVAGTRHEILDRIDQRSWRRLVRPARRLGSLKLLFGTLVLLGTIAGSLPASVTSRLIPTALHARLSEGPLLRNAAGRCAQPEGKRALAAMLARLDPQLAGSIDARVYRTPEFLVAALPGDKLVILREATTATTADQLAALIAHELSHLRHGDPIVAAVRENGLLAVAGKIISGPDNQTLLLTYGGHEEARADREAMAMLRKAGIPLRPAAEMFEEIRVAMANGDALAAGQREFHYGIENRAAAWAAAAQADASPPSPFSREENDALFNLCWAGLLPPPSDPPSGPNLPAGPGRGAGG